MLIRHAVTVISRNTSISLKANCARVNSCVCKTWDAQDSWEAHLQCLQSFWNVTHFEGNCSVSLHVLHHTQHPILPVETNSPTMRILFGKLIYEPCQPCPRMMFNTTIDYIFCREIEMEYLIVNLVAIDGQCDSVTTPTMIEGYWW